MRLTLYLRKSLLIEASLHLQTKTRSYPHHGIGHTEARHHATTVIEVV
jgi:hypothetical protein